MKKCPYCAEEIQEEAIKCKYCQSSLVKQAENKTTALPKGLQLFLIGLAVALVGYYFSSISGGGILDMLGGGLAMAGDLVVVYACYLGVKYLWQKVTNKK